MKRIPRIAVGGSSANPPTLGHQEMLRLLLSSGEFDHVVWVPCGWREDKIELAQGHHRLAMTFFTIPQDWLTTGPPFFCIYPYDIGRRQTRSIILLDEIYNFFFPIGYMRNFLCAQAEMVWFLGADLVMPRREFDGKCEIVAQWFEGEKFLSTANILVMPRPGYPDPETLSLPKNIRIFQHTTSCDISSSLVRDRIAHGFEFEQYVDPRVAQYIKTRKLYGYKGEER